MNSLFTNLSTVQKHVFCFEVWGVYKTYWIKKVASNFDIGSNKFFGKSVPSRHPTF